MQSILVLEAMGYSFDFQENSLTYAFEGAMTPPEAAVYLSRVKSERGAAIGYLRQRERDQQIKAIHDGIWRRFAANIKAAEEFRSRINKAVNTGATPEEVLPLALECIGLMTGDETFYTRNMRTFSGKSES